MLAGQELLLKVVAVVVLVDIQVLEVQVLLVFLSTETVAAVVAEEVVVREPLLHLLTASVVAAVVLDYAD
jgi:hypothetical protein